MNRKHITGIWKKFVASAVAVIAAGLFAVQPSSAQVIVFDPNNWYQNYLTALQTYSNLQQEIQQVAYNYQQLKTMTTGLSGSQLDGYLKQNWSYIQQNAQAESGMASQMGALSTVNQQLAQQFEQSYPGFTFNQKFVAMQTGLNKQLTAVTTDLGQNGPVDNVYQGISKDFDCINNPSGCIQYNASDTQLQTFQKINRATADLAQAVTAAGQVQRTQYLSEAAYQASTQSQAAQDRCAKQEEQNITGAIFGQSPAADQLPCTPTIPPKGP